MAQERKSPNRNTARYNIEKQYIVFINSEVINFSWDESKVKLVCSMWENGMDFEEIAVLFERSPMDVFLLLVDLDEQGVIERSPTEIFGWRVTTT